MKKTSFCLSLILLLTSFSGCGRRQEILNQIESEKTAESAAEESNVVTMGGGRETIPSDPGTGTPDNPIPSIADYPNDEGYRLTDGIIKGGDGYYKGMTVTELAEKSNGFQLGGAVPNQYFNTPLGMFFCPYNELPKYYNKLSGNMSALCPDSLCRHTDCLWSKLVTIQYVNDTHIYFTADHWNETLYRCDTERNHVEALELHLDHTNEQIYYAEGDRVYMTRLVYKGSEAAQCVWGIFDCNTKEYTTIYDKRDISPLAVTGGDTVWYQYYPDETAIYKTDLNFSYEEKVLSGECITVFLSSKEYLLIAEDYIESYLYHMETGKRIPVPEGTYTTCFPTLDGQYLYYAKKVTAEEIALSPLKEYYQYAVGNYHGGENAGDGRIYRMNLVTGEEEVCAELSYNGVPLMVVGLIVDGDAIYVQYLTYEGWNNYFNPEYGKQPDDTIHYRERAPYSFLMVDMDNGTVTMLDPYNIA